MENISRDEILKINKNLREEIAGLKKDLTNAVNQYNAVVEQNKSLQAELREYREKISR